MGYSTANTFVGEVTGLIIFNFRRRLKSSKKSSPKAEALLRRRFVGN